MSFTWLLIWGAATPVHADWINLTGAQSAPNIAEFFVNDDHVRLVLELYVKDLDKFVDLLPDDLLKAGGIDPPPIKERMRRFSQDGFRIDADGHPLQAELKLAEPRVRTDRPNLFAGSINPMTGRPVPGPPEDKRVLYAEVIYPFKEKPRVLTFFPPRDPDNREIVSVGFIAYHRGVPVMDYRYLTQPSRLHLDWDDPWYSKFENKALKRWQLSGLRTFLYIEPFEVRHETLVRVRDLENWMDLGLRGREFIEADEFNALKKRAGEFLLQHSNVRIDGRKPRPILDRVNFVKYTLTRTFFIDQPERMPLNTAMLGVVITYLTKNIPREVTVDWDLFSERIRKVPTNAVDPAGPFPSYVTPDDRVFTWTNYLKTYKPPTVAEVTVDSALTKIKIPIAGALCLLALVPLALRMRSRRREKRSIGLQAALAVIFVIGSYVLWPYVQVAVARPSVMVKKMGNKQAIAVLDSLLNNIYRSFDFREEDDVYDRLATSVSGDLLSEIYLQNRKSLVVTQAGGAQARVKEVTIQDVAVKHLEGRPLALLFTAKWTAMGTVGHWGHTHSRKNAYEANITVEPVEGAWKITGLEMLEEKRIDPYAGPQAPKDKKTS